MVIYQPTSLLAFFSFFLGGLVLGLDLLVFIASGQSHTASASPAANCSSIIISGPSPAKQIPHTVHLLRPYIQDCSSTSVIKEPQGFAIPSARCLAPSSSVIIYNIQKKNKYIKKSEARRLPTS